MKHGTPFIAAFSYLIVALLSLVPGDYRPHIESWSGKEEHVLAYFVLGVATAIASRRSSNPVRLCLAIIAYAGMLECLQLLAPGRHAAVRDFMASSLGGVMGIMAMRFAITHLDRN
jgi:VanZ family protein